MAEPNQYSPQVSGSRLKPIRTDNDLTNLVYGKLQPQATQIEEVVLGALMLDKDAMAVVLDILTPDSFYKKPHGVIFEAMMHLFERSQPVDILTVHEALKKSGGKPEYHSARLVLVDANGEIRGYYDGTDAKVPERIAENLRQLF